MSRYIMRNAKYTILIISLAFIIVGLCIYNIEYIYSFIASFLSYIYIMFASYKSINAKLLDKIKKAKELEGEQKEKSKKLLKFIDFSKASLGFELSFSFARILAFIVMIATLIILEIFHLFYPIVYIAGIFVASICTIIVFLLK